MLRHLAPFVAWLLLMSVPIADPAIGYAMRSVAVLAMLLLLRPWQGYAAMRWAHLPAAIAVGVLVFLVWVVGETSPAVFPALQDLYLRYGIMPFGRVVIDPDPALPYAPETCGMLLTVVRILGSGLVIAPAEEFFWRACLYRVLVDRDFIQVPLNKYRPLAFWVVCIAFGFEHSRWFVGILAGVAYGFLMLRTRSIWPPVIAHALTNLILGIYVVAGDHYGFWG